MFQETVAKEEKVSNVGVGDSGERREGTRADSGQFAVRNSESRVSEMERRVREGV